MFDTGLLQCPTCQDGEIIWRDNKLHCEVCATDYEVEDNIPVLFEGMSQFLVRDDLHQRAFQITSDERRTRIANEWKTVLHGEEKNSGNVLEIGAGSGRLTWGLANEFEFEKIYACDLSRNLLAGIRDQVINGSGQKVDYYMCDANNLPFKEKSFDLIVGHSVLHHFVDRDKTLARMRFLLKEGGKAIFYEPVMQGKLVVAFFADLMLKIERNTGWGVLDEDDKRKIQRMSQHIKKSKWQEKASDCKPAMGQMIFDIGQMEALAMASGYQGFFHGNIEEPVWGYKLYWAQHLLSAGIAPEKIEKFSFISNAFGETFSNCLNHDIKTPTGYFVFCK